MMNMNLKLPLPAEMLIPHRLPMRLVDALISCADTGAEIESIPSADCILVGVDGILDEAALVELLAQSYAVAKGYDDLLQGKPISEGYLVGVRKFQIMHPVHAGEKLAIKIRTVGCFEGFAVAEGEVVRQGEIIARGTIKLWLVNQAGRGSA